MDKELVRPAAQSAAAVEWRLTGARCAMPPQCGREHRRIQPRYGDYPWPPEPQLIREADIAAYR
jgi:hypothetical protein